MGRKLTRWSMSVALATLTACATAHETSPPQRNPWVGAWGYAASPAVEKPGPTLPAGTFRYRIRLTEGGAGLALRFTNPENSVPLVIASVSVAHAANSGFEISGEPVAADFKGLPDATVPPGSSINTDPILFRVAEGQDVIVRVVTAAPTTDVAGNAGFVTEFGQGQNGLTPETTHSRPFVSLISVHNTRTPCTIVALGDSITEGARGKVQGWRGWPGRFAQHLIATNPGDHCSVVNMGISGNRLLAYGRGPSAIDRFARDVLAVPGATHVVLLEGINDIARSGTARERSISARELIEGYRQIIDLAHEHGLTIIGGTMTPAWGARFNTPELERVRRDANEWIREPGNFDAVIDFEAALSDGSSPPMVRAEFDSGDKLHPSDAGYEAMAGAIPPSLFDTEVTGARARVR